MMNLIEKKNTTDKWLNLVGGELMKKQVTPEKKVPASHATEPVKHC